MAKDTPTISTREQIADLQKQIAALKAGAVDELLAKLKEAKAVVSSLEAELAGLVGSSAPAPVKQKRTRKPSFSDDELNASILKVLSEHPNGIAASGIAKELDVNYPRVAKYVSTALAKNPKAFKKTGTGAGTKLFLP